MRIRYIFSIETSEQLFTNFSVVFWGVPNINKQYTAEILSEDAQTKKTFNESSIEALGEKVFDYFSKRGKIVTHKKLTEDDATIKFLEKYYLPLKKEKAKKIMDNVVALGKKYKKAD
ncbi:MAG: hypothetical protein QY309_07665 [Cyclobacteriaceae bacterium]|nr:MAG: hypothetical protein QY309_07665 [Cyclobacteriaceae bacterium]